MRVGLMSDLHLEFLSNPVTGVQDTSFPEADILVLAGDIAKAQSVESILSAILDRFPGEIVYVPGNHEYYKSKPLVVRALLERSRLLPRVHVLENEVVSIGGVRFGGTTLWFPDDPLNCLYQKDLNDFKAIQDFVPWVYREHTKAVAFVDAHLDDVDVMVTHHLPSYASISERHRTSTLNRFFATELGSAISYSGIKYWCHGHTHDPQDHVIGDCRVLCNPRGYPGERTHYPHVVFDVG